MADIKIPAFILTEAGEPIRFDVVTQETHTLVNDITEHPVELGANVTDHVRSQLDTIALEVFVSNAPIIGQDRFQFGSQVGEVRTLDLSAAGTSGIRDPRLGDASASVLQFADDVDWVAETYRALRELKEGADLLTVITPMWDYSSMVIKEIGIPRTAAEGDGAKFTITFKQIRLVETRVVPAPTPTEDRGKAAVNKGAKGTKDANAPEQKKSVLASILDKAGELFK